MILTYEVHQKGPASIATRKQRWQRGQVYTSTDPEVVAYVKANPEVFNVLHEVQRHASVPAQAPKPAPVAQAPAPEPEPEAPVKAKAKPKKSKK